MRDHVELQIGTLQFGFQPHDTPDELTRVSDIVQPPVVWKDIKRILVTIRSRILPITIAVTRITTQCFEQISIDVNLRQYARELDRFENLSRSQIVTVRRS